MELPPFLEKFPGPANSSYCNAIFKHNPPLDPVHALWWPARNVTKSPNTVLLFIPGNPGVLSFYEPFLSAIYNNSSDTLAILGHAHIGHTPGINDRQKHSYFNGLAAQVQSALEALDFITTTYSNARIVIIGHSVGAWIALQLLNSRPQSVTGAFLLFPTISNIRDTPNGKALSWLFRPLPRYVLSSMSHLTVFIPLWVMSYIFWDWPQEQIQVLRKLLRSPTVVNAALGMADEEMQTIKGLDLKLISEHRLWFYYAERDDWVGKQRDILILSLDPDNVRLRIVQGKQDIPHAFCVNHGEKLAQQCLEWLNAI